MLKFYLILPLTFFLISCSSVSYESQGYIASSDWQAVGRYDGSEGLPEKSQQQLQVVSDKFNGGAVDYKQYQESYLAAVIIYCEPKNAHRLAILGKPYMNACDRFPNGGFFYHDWLTSTRGSARG
ncbi:hypothetical protein GCM10007916_09210 [Psychromonas marina]|uniref:DUF2799 domain-containing protein n=1 Tax=Psychromonas marina TaxID=88364 RepID=A0ABQ6DXG9_9GAMM|nr:DUF2799 domain-containing protein [Psychromonas marina]GLS89854.1 hypothetical protein GCM10007916_09210 [Psychromonas marina]